MYLEVPVKELVQGLFFCFSNFSKKLRERGQLSGIGEKAWQAPAQVARCQGTVLVLVICSWLLALILASPE